MTQLAPRESYLRALGIRRDPFATPVAELELNGLDPYTSFFLCLLPFRLFPQQTIYWEGKPFAIRIMHSFTAHREPVRRRSGLP